MPSHYADEPHIQPPMSRKELKELALAISDGQVFGSWMVRETEAPDTLGMIFMPVILGANLPTNAAHLYEYMRDAGPRSINGYPIFMSCRILVKEDVEDLKPMLEQLAEQKKEFMEGGDEDGSTDTPERADTGGAEADRDAGDPRRVDG